MLGALGVGFALPVLALADPVPGASYTGRSADGAGVVFTVSSDGTIVNAYKILGAHGTESSTAGCIMYQEGDAGVWEGAPIVGNSFSYSLGGKDSFQGTFDGRQTASGTFRIDNPATASTAECDTGVVRWTATTSSAPPVTTRTTGSTTTGGTTTTTTTTGGPSGSGHHGERAFTTLVVLHKLSRRTVGGRLKSASRLCMAGRTVILWRGPTRVASTRSKQNGTYAFKRTAADRRQHLRASVGLRTSAGASCNAATSKFIGG